MDWFFQLIGGLIGMGVEEVKNRQRDEEVAQLWPLTFPPMQLNTEPDAWFF
jgi:hypothetical protein